jgi:isopenicillin N synthase-like dioxygenase
MDDSAIPIIDFAAFRSASQRERSDLCRQIRSISGSLGFIYLAGAGVTQAEVDALFTQSAAFFALPDVEKRALSVAHRLAMGLQCGYVPPGREHEDATLPSDIKEAFDIFPTAGYIAEAFGCAARDTLVSAPVQSFTDHFAAFHARCSRAADDVLRAFAVGFGLPESYFVTRHGKNSTLRLLHYPPVRSDRLAGQMRVGPHTDFGTFTLLFQDSSGGLEVLSADGQWLRAPSIPGTVLINIGDLMQQWTNREFRSTEHRVDVPTDTRAARSRYSVAFFCEPNNDVEVTCIPGAIGSDQPRFAPLLAATLLRPGHPSVVRRHTRPSSALIRYLDTSVLDTRSFLANAPRTSNYEMSSRTVDGTMRTLSMSLGLVISSSPCARKSSSRRRRMMIPGRSDGMCASTRRERSIVASGSPASRIVLSSAITAESQSMISCVEQSASVSLR